MFGLQVWTHSEFTRRQCCPKAGGHCWYACRDCGTVFILQWDCGLKGHPNTQPSTPSLRSGGKRLDSWLSDCSNNWSSPGGPVVIVFLTQEKHSQNISKQNPPLSCCVKCKNRYKVTKRYPIYFLGNHSIVNCEVQKSVQWLWKGIPFTIFWEIILSILYIYNLGWLQSSVAVSGCVPTIRLGEGEREPEKTTINTVRHKWRNALLTPSVSGLLLWWECWW